MSIAFLEAKRPFFERAVHVTVKIHVTVKVRQKRYKHVATGIILSTSGIIITAAHVVCESKTAQVQRCSLEKNGYTVRDTGRYTADVIYVDRRADLAILKLRRPPITLAVAKLGDSDELEIGTPLFRVGCDNDKQRLSEGHLFLFGNAKRIPQFSVSMHADDGSSGGPIFDQEGSVMGIVLSGDYDEAFPHTAAAVPINVVRRRILRRRLIKDLMEPHPLLEKATL